MNFLVRIKDEWTRAGLISRTNAHWITLDFAKRANLTPPKALAFQHGNPGKPVTQCAVVDLQVAMPDAPEGFIILSNVAFYVIPESSIHFEWSVYVRDSEFAKLVREALSSRPVNSTPNAPPQVPSHTFGPESTMSSSSPQAENQQPSAQPSPLPANHRLPAELLLRILDLFCYESHEQLKLLCCLNHEFQERFEARLYRHVDLTSLPALESFIESLDARPERALVVQHLAIGPGLALNPVHAKSQRKDGPLPNDALDIKRLRNLRRLLVQTEPTANGWCKGMLQLPKLAELYLYNSDGSDQYLPSLIWEQDQMLKAIGEKVEAEGGMECPKSKEMLRVQYGSRLPLKRIQVSLRNSILQMGRPLI
jgi:hypothetical protein